MIGHQPLELLAGVLAAAIGMVQQRTGLDLAVIVPLAAPFCARRGLLGSPYSVKSQLRPWERRPSGDLLARPGFPQLPSRTMDGCSVYAMGTGHSSPASVAHDRLASSAIFELSWSQAKTRTRCDTIGR